MTPPPPWADGSKLPPPELPRAKAVRQAVVVIGVLYLLIYGGAALAGGTEKRFDHPLLSVSFSAVLMGLLVSLFSVRDPKWRQSLALEGNPLREGAVFGAVGFAIAYGVNIVLGIAFFILTKATGGDPATLAQSKAQWTSQLADIPLPVMLLLALLAGIWEELVFRGFVLGRLRAAFSLDTPLKRDVSAVLVASLAFGLGHGYQGPYGLVQTTVVGIVMAVLTLWRRNLWPALFAHFYVDAFGLVMIKVLKPVLEKILKGEISA